MSGVRKRPELERGAPRAWVAVSTPRSRARSGVYPAPMRTLIEALADCTRAIFLHHATHGYSVTAIEGQLYSNLNWHPTLEEACASFFGEPLDVHGVAFEPAGSWHPELCAAEWWPREHRYGTRTHMLESDWARPFASCGGLPAKPAEADGDGGIVDRIAGSPPEGPMIGGHIEPEPA